MEVINKAPIKVSGKLTSSIRLQMGVKDVPIVLNDLQDLKATMQIRPRGMGETPVITGSCQTTKCGEGSLSSLSAITIDLNVINWMDGRLQIPCGTDFNKLKSGTYEGEVSIDVFGDGSQVDKAAPFVLFEVDNGLQ